MSWLLLIYTPSETVCSAGILVLLLCQSKRTKRYRRSGKRYYEAEETCHSNHQSVLTPIPPLDEQRRILTKLSEVLPVVKSYGAVYGETVAMQEAFPEALKKSILQEAVQGKLVRPTSLQRLCWIVSGRRNSGSSRKAKSKRTSTNPSFSDGIILIMRSWTVRSAVLTMNCPLRYRKIGVRHGSEASLLMQKPSKK